MATTKNSSAIGFQLYFHTLPPRGMKTGTWQVSNFQPRQTGPDNRIERLWLRYWRSRLTVVHSIFQKKTHLTETRSIQVRSSGGHQSRTVVSSLTGRMLFPLQNSFQPASD